MSIGKDLLVQTKDDAADAAYRIASKQMATVVRQAILKMLAARGTKKAQVKAFGEFLETELGQAFIQAILGYGITYLPMLKDNPKFQAMGKEFRIASMSTVGNTLMDAVMGEIMPTLMPVINQLPETKVEAKQLEVPEEILAAGANSKSAKG